MFCIFPCGRVGIPGYSTGMLHTARWLKMLRIAKKLGRNFTFCLILMKNKSQDILGNIFSLFLWNTGVKIICFPRELRKESKLQSIPTTTQHIGNILPGVRHSLQSVVLLAVWLDNPNTGPLFTKKTPSYGYRNPLYKPKTVWPPYQVYNGNPYTDKTVSS